MDPITILAACTAVWNGIKQASEFANEAEGVWSQLSKYVGLADQLEQHITEAKNGKKYINLAINRKKEPDQYGKDLSVAVDTWKPEPKEVGAVEHPNYVNPIPVKQESVKPNSGNIDFRNSNSLAEAFNSDSELPF